MTKKIVLGIVLAGLIGVLVAGAAVRTLDKSGQVAEARGLEEGRGYGRTEDCDEYVEGAQGQGYRGGATAVAASVRGGYAQGGYDGEGFAAAPGDGTGTGQAQVDEWVTLHGTVTAVDENALVVQTDGGEQVTVENRPWWFAQEQGFSAQVGDRVVLVGFYENGEFEMGKISHAGSLEAVDIREESGRPLWAGRGRRGG